MIYEDMHFYTFDEFYSMAKRIKSHYEKLTLQEKCIYKMYFYCNRIIKEWLLDKMWEYLNEPIGSCYYVSYEMLGAYKR